MIQEKFKQRKNKNNQKKILIRKIISDVIYNNYFDKLNMAIQHYIIIFININRIIITIL